VRLLILRFSSRKQVRSLSFSYSILVQFSTVVRLKKTLSPSTSLVSLCCPTARAHHSLCCSAAELTIMRCHLIVLVG
jgi:hypothetical protein